MSDAIAAFGTLLKIGSGGTAETFTTIVEVTEIGGPKFAADTVDVTNHSSSSAWREKLPTLIDAGEVSMKLNFLPATATHSQSTGLLRDFKNRTKRNFQIVFPDTPVTTWSFAAYVTGFEISAPVDDKLSADVTLTITGAPTLA